MATEEMLVNSNIHYPAKSATEHLKTHSRWNSIREKRWNSVSQPFSPLLNPNLVDARRRYPVVYNRVTAAPALHTSRSYAHSDVLVFSHREYWTWRRSEVLAITNVAKNRAPNKRVRPPNLSCIAWLTFVGFNDSKG